MSFFKRLFGNKAYPYSSFPEIKKIVLTVPEIKKRRTKLANFILEEHLATLTHAIPRRVAKLYQGKDQDQYRLFAVIKSGKENQKWLLERLGGSKNIQNSKWKKINSRRIMLGMDKELHCLVFDCELTEGYCLQYRILEEEQQEVWVAWDKNRQKNVVCTLIKPGPEISFPKNFVKREFLGKETLVKDHFPELLNVLDEGYIRTIGPFASNRFKFSRIYYIITEVPSIMKPLTHIRAKLKLEEAVSVLCQLARLLHCLQPNWSHGKISKKNLWLGNGEKKSPTVFLNGYSLINPEVSDNTASEILHSVPPFYRASAKNDQLMLAVTVYHLISGKNLLTGLSPQAAKARLQKGFARPSHIPVWFVKILKRMTAPDPNKRFEDLQKVVEIVVRQMEKAIEQKKEKELAKKAKEKEAVRKAKEEAKAKKQKMKESQKLSKEIDESEWEEMTPATPQTEKKQQSTKEQQKFEIEEWEEIEQEQVAVAMENPEKIADKAVTEAERIESPKPEVSSEKPKQQEQPKELEQQEQPEELEQQEQPEELEQQEQPEELEQQEQPEEPEQPKEPEEKIDNEPEQLELESSDEEIIDTEPDSIFDVEEEFVDIELEEEIGDIEDLDEDLLEDSWEEIVDTEVEEEIIEDSWEEIESISEDVEAEVKEIALSADKIEVKAVARTQELGDIDVESILSHDMEEEEDEISSAQTTIEIDKKKQ